MRTPLQIIRTVAGAALSLALFGCGGSDKGNSNLTTPTTSTTGAVVGVVNPGATDLPPSQPVAPVPIEPVPEAPLPTIPISVNTLKALLPETIRGFDLHRELQRTNTTYTTENTYAERTYFGEGSSILVYRIKDAHKPNLVNIDAKEIKREPDLNEDDDSQLLRVTEIDGFPCFEKHVKTRNDSKIQVLVEDRVLVEVTGIMTAGTRGAQGRWPVSLSLVQRETAPDYFFFFARTGFPIFERHASQVAFMAATRSGCLADTSVVSPMSSFRLKSSRPLG